MGKKLDALLGRTSKTSKFITLAKLAISRIAILKNQRQVRHSHARSDVIQLINLGHQERALLRVEHVIKEQYMLEVLVMIESYCYLLTERTVLIDNNECPDEFKEAISSLLFAASRCGEFPELQQIREILTSRFGKEFAARAIELRNNCGVNPKMIQKLSTQQPSLESRLKELKDITSENGITLHLEGDASEITKEKLDVNQKQKQLEPNEPANIDDPQLGDDTRDFPEKINRDEKFSESMKTRKKYRDVAAAAQDAFESAAYAAAAARAAVELSRSESRDEDSDDHSESNCRQGIASDSDGSLKSKLQTEESAASEIKYSNNGLGFDKIHPIENFSSDSEGEEMAENNYISHLNEWEQSKKKAGIERALSASSSNSEGNTSSERKMSLNQRGWNEPLCKEIVFDESDDETGKKQGNIPWLKHHDMGSDRKSSLPTNEFPRIRQYNAVADEDLSDENGNKLHYRSPKWIPLNSRADPMAYSAEGRPRLENSQHSNINRKPVLVRTRHLHRGSEVNERREAILFRKF